MQVYRIDEHGYYIKPVIIQDDKTPVDCVEIQPPEGLYRARWIGTEWIEDMTQEEIDELNRPHMKEPTTEEYLLDLDFRLACLELGI